MFSYSLTHSLKDLPEIGRVVPVVESVKLVDQAGCVKETWPAGNFAVTCIEEVGPDSIRVSFNERPGWLYDWQGVLAGQTQKWPTRAEAWGAIRLFISAHAPHGEKPFASRSDFLSAMKQVFPQSQDGMGYGPEWMSRTFEAHQGDDDYTALLRIAARSSKSIKCTALEHLIKYFELKDDGSKPWMQYLKMFAYSLR